MDLCLILYLDQSTDMPPGQFNQFIHLECKQQILKRLNQEHQMPNRSFYIGQGLYWWSQILTHHNTAPDIFQYTLDVLVLEQERQFSLSQI